MNIRSVSLLAVESLVLAVALARAAPAQTNVVPNLDIELQWMEELEAIDRVGAFPNGTNAVAFATVACNRGPVEIPWQAAMDPDHPFIAFMLAREWNGRFEQISDRGHVKHGYTAETEHCLGCTPSPHGNTYLGVGCKDTYSLVSNQINYSLGPADEVDPWSGIWTPECSLFDRGVPPAPPPLDCDGVRSFTFEQSNALGPLGHRVRVKDADLAASGASFYFQGFYVVAGEADAVRGDSIASFPFTAGWTGSAWDLDEGGNRRFGSVLGWWSGASIASAVNGNDDGRVFLAVKITGPFQGFYHYEFALHNRDNARGIGALSIPKCTVARVRNAGSSDIDDVAGNDWSVSITPGEISFSTTSNPVRWNTIHNFWFDSDGAPLAGSLSLHEFAPGPGLDVLSIPSSAPLGLEVAYEGPGCALGTPPTLYATGTPAQAVLGNASFGIGSSGNVPGEINLLIAGVRAGVIPVQGCRLWMGGKLGADAWIASRAIADDAGETHHPLPVPDSIAFAGLEVRLQALGRDPCGGILFSGFELSEALRVRVVNPLDPRMPGPTSPCP